MWTYIVMLLSEPKIQMSHYFQPRRELESALFTRNITRWRCNISIRNVNILVRDSWVLDVKNVTGNKEEMKTKAAGLMDRKCSFYFHQLLTQTSIQTNT